MEGLGSLPRPPVLPLGVMQVVSLAPVPVASMPWRIGDSSWVLTVVCKL